MRKLSSPQVSGVRQAKYVACSSAEIMQLAIFERLLDSWMKQEEALLALVLGPATGSRQPAKALLVIIITMIMISIAIKYVVIIISSSSSIYIYIYIRIHTSLSLYIYIHIIRIMIIYKAPALLLPAAGCRL